MYITAQGPRLRNDLYCVEWDVKLYYTIPQNFAVKKNGEIASASSDEVLRTLHIYLLSMVAGAAMDTGS